MEPIWAVDLVHLYITDERKCRKETEKEWDYILKSHDDAGGKHNVPWFSSFSNGILYSYIMLGLSIDAAVCIYFTILFSHFRQSSDSFSPPSIAPIIQSFFYEKDEFATVDGDKRDQLLLLWTRNS